MNKYIKTYLFTLLFMIIYYLLQLTIVSTATILMGLEFAVSNNISADSTEFTKYIMSNASYFTIISSILAILFYMLIIYIRKQKVKEVLSLKSTRIENYLIMPLLSLSLIFAVNFLLILLENSGALTENFESHNKLMEIIDIGDNILLLILATGIIAPIAEEILFRGVILGELKNVHRITTAVIIQALLFGAFHLNIIQAIYAFVLGLFLGFVTVKTRSIIPAVIIHIVFNTFNVLAAKGILDLSYIDGAQENLMVLLTSFGLIAIITVYIWINPFKRYFKYKDS